MNASKETAKKALERLANVRAFGAVARAERSLRQAFDRDAAILQEFIEAAERKLPTEAACDDQHQD